MISADRHTETGTPVPIEKTARAVELPTGATVSAGRKVDGADVSAEVLKVHAAWTYCPECGSDDVRHEEGDHKQCAKCRQEWFADIDYTDVVRGHLAKLAPLSQDRDRLVEALNKYGMHSMNCGVFIGMKTMANDPNNCTCGFRAALVRGKDASRG